MHIHEILEVKIIGSICLIKTWGRRFRFDYIANKQKIENIQDYVVIENGDRVTLEEKNNVGA